MKKLRKIIKDIVKQQAEYAQRINEATQPQAQRVRSMSHKKMIITDDGVGRR